MAHDFEDIHDIDDLDDGELTGLVREHLSENNMLDIDDIAVRTHAGVVHLQGRVGTEAEQRVAERIVTDVLGIVDVRNELVVDPIRRGLTSEAIDDHLAEVAATEGGLLGDMPEQQSDEVELNLGDGQPDDHLIGTTDVQDSIAHGTAWIPPTSPTPEGLGGSDVSPEALGEDH